MSRKVGLVVHETKPEAHAIAKEVIDWLQARHIESRLNEEMAQRLGAPSLACCAEEMAGVEFIITLGGDGTILKAAKMAAPSSIPILGVHMGRFGFIAESHPSDLFDQLTAILEGKQKEEVRMMVRAEVWREGERVHHSVGLNEALVKSSMSHLMRLNTSLGGAPFATYPADGFIVATPTGSTAYALSAGGPLVEPTVEAFVLVPICPHTLSARPMVVPGSEIIDIEIEADGGEMLFAVDGVDPFALKNGDRIHVRRADCVTRLIVLDRSTFYRKVHNRYLYGERLNE